MVWLKNKMPHKKPTIVFDIGAVKLGLNYGRDENSFFVQASKIAGVSPDEFKAWYSPIEKRCLSGEVRADEHYFLLRQKLGQPGMPKDELEDLVGLLWTGPIISTIRLSERLHNAGHGLGIISNMTDYCIDIISKKHPEVFETFGGKKVFSFEHRVIKPDLRLYKEFDEIEGDKVYIDDNLRYASAPLVLPDWFGIHYTEHIDSSESVRSVQDKSSGFPGSDRLFVARNNEELIQALERCNVKL